MASFFQQIADLETAGHPFVLATVIHALGSSPQKSGKKMAVLSDGSIIGTIGGGRIELKAIEAALASLKTGQNQRIRFHLTHDLGMCCGGEMEIFIEVIHKKSSLVIFGAGHVAKHLAEFASKTGFEVTIVDEREAYANPERFPQAKTIVTEHHYDAIQQIQWDPVSTYVIVVTHDHQIDEEIVYHCIGRSYRFLGMIGSRRKALRFKMRLKARGICDIDLKRLTSPVGLNIGAETPEEIAVSIVAQLISVKNTEIQEQKTIAWEDQCAPLLVSQGRESKAE